MEARKLGVKIGVKKDERLSAACVKSAEASEGLSKAFNKLSVDAFALSIAFTRLGKALAGLHLDVDVEEDDG